MFEDQEALDGLIGKLRTSFQVMVVGLARKAKIFNHVVFMGEEDLILDHAKFLLNLFINETDNQCQYIVAGVLVKKTEEVLPCDLENSRECSTFGCFLMGAGDEKRDFPETRVRLFQKKKMHFTYKIKEINETLNFLIKVCDFFPGLSKIRSTCPSAKRKSAGSAYSFC